ncbi:MAG: type II secretion system secretin GspD, partial [Proteobacteria bacterium]|nr:type II secretion system secretin GspD [Pseudomonadota bacterium]
DAVVKAAADITGRNFIVDPRVKGTINIVSSRPVPRDLVYPTLVSALRMQGIVAVEGDGVVKLLPETDARTQAGPVIAGGTATGGALTTEVIPLRFESATQLVAVLRPLIPPNNTIAAFPGSNALVITDYADNLRRIERIVASLDLPPSGEPVLVPLRNASAIDLVATLNKLLNDSSGPGQPVDATQKVLMVADPRSNGVLLRADNPARAARARQLIEQLDTPTRAGGNMFIVYLRNADATKVAATLRSMLTGSDSGTPTSQGSTLTPQTAGLGSTNANGAANNGAAGGGSLMTAAQALPFSPATANSTFTAGGATIAADATSNALVIMAPEPVYNNLRTIIEKLDVRRAQVYIEALIAEVSADKAAEFGIQWQSLSGTNSSNTRVIGGTNFGTATSGTNILDIAANPLSAANGLNLGIIRGTLTIPGVGQILNLALLARALENTTNANILSTPTVLTMDNEEARIIVGENVPFITGQYATTGSTNTVTPFQTIERRDVGLVLRVKPQITEGGAIRINLYQEVSRVESQTASGPILQKRAMDSTVTVDDGSIAVLGGLIQDQLTDGSSKVPVAGDLPLLGPLFRYDTRQRTKTNLMIFLRPVVLRTAEDGQRLTSERYDYLRGQQELQGMAKRIFWTDPSTQPALPLPMGTMMDTPAGATVPPQSPDIVGPPAPPTMAPPAPAAQ